jgi:GMP synthase-like glutamine amidotransferase
LDSVIINRTFDGFINEDLMKILCLQHVPFEGPGSIAPWAAVHRIALEVALVPETPKLPALTADSWLLVMGGPMGVNDGDRLPWLAEETAYIRRAIEAGRVVIGICLGAQLIAAALGATVSRNPEREIGWFPLHKTERALADGICPFLPQGALAFHWHGDTFAIPEGATALARTDACANQGFVMEQRVFAFQFHLETTPASARALVTHCRAELLPRPFVQSDSEVFADADRFTRINGYMAAFLEEILKTRTG